MAVDNEKQLLWYKNEEKYINDTNIAALLQDMLNQAAGKPLFKVYLETKTTLKADEAYTCTLKTRIEPYMLKGAHCENVNVRLSIKYPLENEQEKINVINIVTKCLGFITGGFKCHSDGSRNGHDIGDSDESIEYTFCSNFTKDESTTPENINSHYTGTITLKGNMHITRMDGGLLGDTVENFILLGDKEYGIVGRSVEGAWQAVTDNPIKAGSFVPETEYNAVANAKSLIIFFRNDYICNLLRDFAHGILRNDENPFINMKTGKPELTLKEIYPYIKEEEDNSYLSTKEIIDTYYINEVKETREAGSYMCLSVALLKKP